ncbi:hypothetical protein PGB34_06605 [Xenophilus arseniciresistens]|uniref:Uncharacterized protein n=1 Tax=Xenophilus arseniciresistens TaxID=1283306 RepID=A0AAE3N6Z2_9BURK|nr:hypothetical protein [Xenophilus arseniciresistens]MDA7416033.1 hypothetical protein [Xenophilus arseniciresistens]
MPAVMAVTASKVSPSGRYAWHIFEREEDAGSEGGVVVICESLETFSSMYSALLSGQRVLQSICEQSLD